MQVKNYSVNGINLCPRIRCVPFKMTNLQVKVHKVKLSGRHSSVVSSVLTILRPNFKAHPSMLFQIIVLKLNTASSNLPPQGSALKENKLDCFKHKHIFCFKLLCASIVYLLCTALW